MRRLPNILILHPDQIIAEVIAGVLQLVYGLNALPVTSAVDAIEHVENLCFDVAVVSNEMPAALPQLLFDSHRANWLEILQIDLTRGVTFDLASFALAVREAASESSGMCFMVEMAWDDGWYGEAGYDPCTATEEESDAKICRSLIRTLRGTDRGLDGDSLGS